MDCSVLTVSVYDMALASISLSAPPNRSRLSCCNHRPDQMNRIQTMLQPTWKTWQAIQSAYQYAPIRPIKQVLFFPRDFSAPGVATSPGLIERTFALFRVESR